MYFAQWSVGHLGISAKHVGIKLPLKYSKKVKTVTNDIEKYISEV